MSPAPRPSPTSRPSRSSSTAPRPTLRVWSEQLHLALNSRIAIEQAKGVLAEQGRVDMDAAFVRLRAYARRTQRMLSDVAQDVVNGALTYNDLR